MFPALHNHVYHFINMYDGLCLLLFHARGILLFAPPSFSSSLKLRLDILLAWLPLMSISVSLEELSTGASPTEIVRAMEFFARGNEDADDDGEDGDRCDIGRGSTTFGGPANRRGVSAADTVRTYM